MKGFSTVPALVCVVLLNLIPVFFTPRQRTHPLIPLDIALRTFEVRVEFFPFGVVAPLRPVGVPITVD
jgi:hypothetical protein